LLLVFSVRAFFGVLLIASRIRWKLPHSRFDSSQRSTASGLSANRKLAYAGLLLGKESRLSGRILCVAEIAQADANETEALVRTEADTFPQ